MFILTSLYDLAPVLALVLPLLGSLLAAGAARK